MLKLFSIFVSVYCISCLDDSQWAHHLEGKTIKLGDLYSILKGQQKQNQTYLSDSNQQNLVLMDSSESCDAGWKQYSGNGCCYLVSEERGPWETGESRCQALHPYGRLASLHSKEESVWIAKQYSTLLDSIHAWTALSQTEIPGVWTNTDGTEVFRWFFDNSDVEMDHSCVEIIDGLLAKILNLFAQQGQTNPYNCSESIPALCKYCPGDTTTSTVLSTTTTKTTTQPTTTKLTTVPTTTSLKPTSTVSSTTSTKPTTVPSTTKEVTTVKTTKITTPTTLSTTLLTSKASTVPAISSTTKATTVTTTVLTSKVPTVPAISSTTKATTVPTTVLTSKVPTVSTTTSKQSYTCESKCETGWVFFKDSCYSLVESATPVDISTAKKGCYAFGGELADLQTSDETTFVAGYFGGFETWINNAVTDPNAHEIAGSSASYCTAIDENRELQTVVCSQKFSFAICKKSAD
ncbi:unnamed protein product [Caenorhabditis angaria]|uniref:C-type lectin domain-containing protein n=1 Tax=Caenorhabditis angaria TaxID=860376 RepID=A0A9P1N2L3_9PELO|nr:unnamed protein product [Caenorhabditis angaria]